MVTPKVYHRIPGDTCGGAQSALQFAAMYLLLSLYSWCVFLWVPVKWFCYRAGLLQRRPMFIDHYDESQRAWGQMTRWNPRLRVVGAENCPQGPPAIFAGNHIKLDDPFFAWRSAHRASGETIHLYFMMRDDYFQGFPWTLSPIPINEICEMGGGVKISRDNPSLSQMKPFLEILKKPGSFVIFPGRTRTRSGLVMEFREGFDEPGGVSFFLMHGQRRCGVPIPCVPIARTHNVMTHKSAVVIAPPRYLDPAASRDAQRDFDFALAVAIGELIEINLIHIVSGLLYLRALHARDPRVRVDALLAAVQQVVRGLLPPRHHDPALDHVGAKDLRRVLRFLARRGLLRAQGADFDILPEAVLSVPPLDTTYLKRNPIKYHVNQILHLGDVVALLEDAVW